MGIKFPTPWKTLIIKFPPLRDGKGVKCPGYARGGGMLKLRFDRYINATYLKHYVTRHLQWAPKWRFMLSLSFSRLTLINNYYMRALTNHFSVRDLGIFPVWTLPETEINNFNDFTNSFRTTINSTLELSSKQIVLLDTEVFKGPRFIQTHFETS